MLHKDKLMIGHDRQSSTEVKNPDMDHTGEGVASEQSISKLSRNSKGSANKRKPAKEDRPSSAKSVSSIENKYKSSFIKYTKELKEIQTQSEKLVTLRESMGKMREEMIEKGLRDPPTLPEMPESMMISSSRPPSRSSSPKGKLARQLSSSKNKSLVEETNIKVSNSGILDIILGELPFIEQSFKNLELTINTAHEKQTSLETNLDIYKNDVTNILMNIINSNDGKNSDLLIQELQSIKEKFELEKNSLMNQLSLKDEELRTLKTYMENEQSKKLNLEGTLSATYEQNHELKEKCDRYSHQIEMLQKYQMMSQQNSGNQDLSIQNAQLLCEVDGLKAKLGQAQDQYEISTKQIEKFKQELNKLKDEKEEIKNELLQQCQQVYFEKQDQIYSIKRKMDSIVNLKNSMMSTDVTPDEVFNLQVLMKINDPDFLKNEIVSFHKRLQDEEEAKTQLEYNLSAQDNKVDNLQEALSEKTKMLHNMESLIKTLKNKVNRSHELITSLRSDEFNENDEMKSKNDDEIEEDLVEWLAYQNDEVAELQQKLKLSEEKFCMAEERRVRNEERIANLEIKLSKYAYR